MYYYYQMWEGQSFKIETIRKNIICLNVQSTKNKDSHTRQICQKMGLITDK